MLNKFNIAETEYFKEKIQHYQYKTFYNKIYTYVYPQLKNNPFFGHNIKKLKSEFEKVYRYRIGKIRLFYTIDIEKEIVIIIDIEYRKDAYRN
ncbi:MAG: type II toxin-antitoxin system RelE/ParE family toxin [Candidatus Firestonebacteria bacterium]